MLMCLMLHIKSSLQARKNADIGGLIISLDADFDLTVINK